MTSRPRSCPFANRATHPRNRKIQVDAWVPIVYGYCPQTEDCASCAGTGFKPNLEVKVGRPHEFLPCPYCLRDEYRRRVERINATKK